MIILTVTLILAGLFCIGGFLAGEYYRKHGEKFRIGEIE